jgi:hypothetical protein
MHNNNNIMVYIQNNHHLHRYGRSHSLLAGGRPLQETANKEKREKERERERE